MEILYPLWWEHLVSHMELLLSFADDIYHFIELHLVNMSGYMSPCLADRLAYLTTHKHVQLSMCLLHRCSTSFLVDWTSSSHSLHYIPLLTASSSGTESSASIAWDTERSRPSTHSLTSENFGLYAVSHLSTPITNCSRHFLLFLTWNFCTATNAHQQTPCEHCSSWNMCWLLSFRADLDLPPIQFLWGPCHGSDS